MNKEKSKAKKVILTVLLILAIAACVLLAAYSAFGLISRKMQYDRINAEPVPQNGGFYPIDFEQNPEDDKEYLGKNRFISYTNETGAVTETITDGNYSDFGEDIVFFDKYFTVLREGDYRNYDTLFTRSYFDKHEHTDISYGFTKQKIYNIYVNYCKKYTSRGTENTIYQVLYYIYKNDGTFRNDIRSDECIPQYFTLAHTKDGVFISDIAYGYDLGFDYAASDTKDEIFAAIAAVLILAVMITVSVIRKKKGKNNGREAS